MADSGHLISHDLCRLWLITNKHYLESLACLVKKGTNEHPPWPDHLLQDQRPPIDENYHRKHGKYVQFYHIRLCKIITFVTTYCYNWIIRHFVIFTQHSTLPHSTTYYQRITLVNSFHRNSAILIICLDTFTIGNSFGIHFYCILYTLSKNSLNKNFFNKPQKCNEKQHNGVQTSLGHKTTISWLYFPKECSELIDGFVKNYWKSTETLHIVYFWKAKANYVKSGPAIITFGTTFSEIPNKVCCNHYRDQPVFSFSW